MNVRCLREELEELCEKEFNLAQCGQCRGCFRKRRRFIEQIMHELFYLFIYLFKFIYFSIFFLLVGGELLYNIVVVFAIH